nr:hypothetical protein [Tanacetum cinerariifolium]
MVALISHTVYSFLAQRSINPWLLHISCFTQPLKTALGAHVEVLDEILEIQSREFRGTGSLCVVSVRLSEVSPEHLPEISSGGLSGTSVVRLIPLSFTFFTFPFPLHHMSFGSQIVGDVVVSKFDMHVYTSVLTSNEVKTLVVEYAIPLDLHPCVPPFGLTMNMLSADKIGGQGKIFNEFCTSLKHWKDWFFHIDRRAISDAMSWRHQDSSVVDPSPTGVRSEDIRRLCENVIDLRLVHPTMLYAIGLTTIWKHVGHHPVFKDGEGTVVISMSQFLKFPMAEGVRVGKGVALTANEVIPQHTTSSFPFGSQIPEKSDHQRVVEYENERVLAAKRKVQAAKDRAAGLRAPTEGASQLHQSKNTDRYLDHVKDTTEVNSYLFEHSSRSQHSDPSDEDAHNVRDETAHTHASCSTGQVSSSSGGSHRQAFPRRNPGGDGIATFTVFQRLLSSGEYKKSLTDVFNLEIAAGWSNDVKEACFEEEEEAFWPSPLTMIQYARTPLCLSLIPFSTRVTHMWRNWLSPSGFLWGICKICGRKCASLGHWILDSSGTFCVPGNVRHLAIGSWTHLERLAF